METKNNASNTGNTASLNVVLQKTHVNATYLTLTPEIFSRRRTLWDGPESSGKSSVRRASDTSSL